MNRRLFLGSLFGAVAGRSVKPLPTPPGLTLDLLYGTAPLRPLYAGTVTDTVAPLSPRLVAKIALDPLSKSLDFATGVPCGDEQQFFPDDGSEVTSA